MNDTNITIEEIVVSCVVLEEYARAENLVKMVKNLEEMFFWNDDVDN